MGRAGLLLLGCVALAACDKVPIVNINAGFTIADATWFEEEQTLFVFYTLNAEQGLGEDSVIELAYRTDALFQDWTDVAPLPRVHTHVPVDCGEKARCGSLSLHVPTVPRDVGIRLRYHRDGEVVLNTATTFNVIATGPAHTHRSLLVYGVFDSTNQRVQWRARHQFPTLRNEQVQGLGLRREFAIRDRVHGEPGVSLEGNPYGYGITGTICPPSMDVLPALQLKTSNRAIFESISLPVETSPSPAVCAVSTVTDATGTFEAVALARKNPEVKDAFPLLRSPITENLEVQFLLTFCNREISPEHEAMQIQRLLLDGAVEVCLDDWQNTAFTGQLASILQTRINEARSEARDMVLTIALHHDVTNGQLSAVVENALGRVLPSERDKSSPRVSGAFVFDTAGRSVVSPEVNALALWCPARFTADDLENIPNQASSVCAVQPDLPDLELGPFRFNTLPILPSRAQYLTFLEKYGDAQGGRMIDLRFLAPQRTPLSENVPYGTFGTVTFFNNESFSAAAGDAFSLCTQTTGEGGESVPAPPVFFRVDPSMEPLPISTLPEFHAAVGAPSYQVGLFWEFPFLARLQYEVFAAGSATAYDFTVPFGLGVREQRYSGAALWEQGEFALSEVLDQCVRFCDHPTFDSAGANDSPPTSGTYNVLAPFREAYRTQCYAPSLPDASQKIEEVFPRDP